MSRRTLRGTHPVLGSNDHIGEGDSYVVYNAISNSNQDSFTALKNEIHWQKMSHAQGEVPRLVCAQGVMDESDGSMPVYRHPSDQSLPLLHFSRIVRSIRDDVQTIVGHSMNHVLIQLYRGGKDNISEHSDKTLDIVRGSVIVNVSLGAQRTMRLRTKRSAFSRAEESGRKTQLVPLPHGSVFVLGTQTNMAWLHGINADKRPNVERTEEELAFQGERISLTFRHIGTFLDAKSKFIWGQGACTKDKNEAHCIVNGDPDLTQQMIDAFGFENRQSVFDWNAAYGNGFDVLHFTLGAAEELPLLFASHDQTDKVKVQIYLAEIDLRYQAGGVISADAGHEHEPTICFRDTDMLKTQIYGVVPILTYLSWKYSSNTTPESVITEASRMISEYNSATLSWDPEYTLNYVEECLNGREYVAGTHFSIADCFFWPLVDVVFRNRGERAEAYPITRRYWMRVKTRESMKKAMVNGSDACFDHV